MAAGFPFQGGKIWFRGEGFRAGELEAGSRERLDVETEEIVPVFGRRRQALDGGMKIAHALGHKVAGGISVKAAVDGLALFEELA